MAWQQEYEYLHKTYRLLHHETLDCLLRYPRIPRKTINFDMYPIFKRRRNNQITLGGSVTTEYQGKITDPVISEIWSADGVSIESGFFYELLRFYNAVLNSSDHLIWYPKDKTEKCFSILPLALTAGGEDMNVNPIHNVSRWDYRFLTTEIRFSFRIRRIFEMPQAVATLEGA
jgi:hypothetical protein